MIEPGRALLSHFTIIRPEVTPFLGALFSCQALATSVFVALGRWHHLLFHSGTELSKMVAYTWPHRAI